MIVVTTENIPGYRVKESKGQVFGVVVRSRLNVLNRSIWDQLIFGPECTARPTG